LGGGGGFFRLPPLLVFPNDTELLSLVTDPDTDDLQDSTLPAMLTFFLAPPLPLALSDVSDCQLVTDSRCEFLEGSLKSETYS
jgi:hypothetical protein